MKHRWNTDILSESGTPDSEDFHLTRQIIGSAFEVHSKLGYGFLERVYQKAMQVELSQREVSAVLESPLQVKYKGILVGDFSADLLVENSVIVEIKVATKYRPEDEAQLLNELKATGLKIGLLLNFGRAKVEFKRLVF